MASKANGTIIVTGAAGGIGRGFVAEFLKSPQAKEYHCLYLYHPSEPGSLKSLVTKSAPKEQTYELIPLDLSLMSNIHTFTTVINKRIADAEIPPITHLLLIAGGIFTTESPDPSNPNGLVFSAEDIEMTFAVNYIANVLLSILLLPSLQKSRPGARIIFASSTTHDPSFKTNSFAIKKSEHHVLFNGVEALSKGTYQGAEGGDVFGAALRRYGSAKLCMVLFMYEFQRRLNANPELKNIKIVAHDPGAVGGTAHYEPHTFPFLLYVALKYILVPVQAASVIFNPNGPIRSTGQVGKDLVWACWDAGVKGAMYLDGKRVVGSSPESMEEGKQALLWGETMGMLRLGTEEGGLALAYGT